MESRPARARGLKHERFQKLGRLDSSRPARARGLKPIPNNEPDAVPSRAPCGRVD